MRYTILILIISFSVCSEYYSSLYGIGEKVLSTSPSKISLGWSNLFSANNMLSSDNLSSIYNSENVRLSVSSNFNFTQIEDKNYFSQKLNNFKFLLPLKKNKYGFGFSISPYYRISSNIIENEYNYVAGSEIGQPLAYKSEYSFDGGPSVFSLMFSTNVNSKFSYGASFEYIFGSLYSHVKHNVFNVDYDIENNIAYSFNSLDQYTSVKNFKGYGLRFEANYKFFKNIFVGSMNLLSKNEIIEFFYDDISPGALEIGGIDYNSDIRFDFSSPLEINLGYSRQVKNGFYIIEFYNYKPFEANRNLLSNPDLNKTKVNLGYQKLFSDSKITFGSGIYYIDSFNQNINSNRYGLTMGIGFNPLKNVSFDIAFDFGKNVIQISEKLDENFINLYVGISTSDKWFK